MYNEKFMKEALDLAQIAIETGQGGPFGAVIVKDGKIVGRGRNSVTINNDPTAHAEVMAIRSACANLNTFQLLGCEIYTSCEPCPMCLGAIYWARPEAIYFAANREDASKAGFDDDFIYSELELPSADRKITTEQHPSQEAVQLFYNWKKLTNKIDY